MRTMFVDFGVGAVVLVVSVIPLVIALILVGITVLVGFSIRTWNLHRSLQIPVLRAARAVVAGVVC